MRSPGDPAVGQPEQGVFCVEVGGDVWACMFQVPTVAELEGNMHQLLRQRACRLVQRRQDDIKDESAEFASLSSQSILKVRL